MNSQFVMMSVSKLKPAPYNPRTISPEEMVKLENSIAKFGIVENIVWNKRTGNVVGGNQRLQAIKNLKYREVPVIVVDLSLEKEKVLNLALNRISGEWDFPALKLVIESLDDADRVLSGFDAGEIDNLLQSLSVPDPHLIERVSPEKPKKEIPAHEEARKPIPPPAVGQGAGEYVVYLTFKTRPEADRWLKDNLGDEKGIGARKKTKVVNMK